MRWHVSLLVWALSASLLAQDSDRQMLQRFYSDYVQDFALRQKSQHPAQDLVRFLKSHQEHFEPRLYQQLLQVEQPWVLHEQKKGPAPGLVAEHDYLSGSAGDQLSDLWVGPLQRGQIAVGISSTDMQGEPIRLKLTLIMENHRIADIVYGGRSRLSDELSEVLRTQSQPAP